MIANKKEFGAGLGLMIGFWIVFVILLSPVFGGQNLLDYMDSMYNSISKKSAYYIPEAKEKAQTLKGNSIDLTVETGKNLNAVRLASLLGDADMMLESGSGQIRISGDLGVMLESALIDADAMFANDGEAVRSRHGYDERQAMFDWWTLLGAMEKSLIKQEKFNESKILYQIRTRSLEPAYNFYGITAQSIREKIGVVVISLAGYVVYTMWFGFAILFMFEGWGLQLKH
jgi:hypothetical protein